MRPIRWFMAALAVTAIAAPALAQESAVSLRDRILQAARLPEATQEARVLGVPERDLRTIFGTAREQRLPAGVLTEVIVTQNEAVREHGPVENFGAFVQSRLAQGLRGRELAAAIRAEHASRGIGKGKRLRDDSPGPPAPSIGGNGAGSGPGSSGERGGGKPADAGKPKDAGRPSGDGTPDAGQAAGAGKSDSPGKSGESPGRKGGK